MKKNIAIALLTLSLVVAIIFGQVQKIEANRMLEMVVEYKNVAEEAHMLAEENKALAEIAQATAEGAMARALTAEDEAKTAKEKCL